MLGINLKHSLATVAVVAGILATAGSASAASATDGTSNTAMFGARAAVVESIGTKYTMFLPLQADASKNEMAIETIESAAVFSGDAYDNEMGLRDRWLLPDVDDEVL